MLNYGASMPMSENKPGSNRGTARFGVFELDLAAGELRKSGSKLRLQEQPFQVLAALIERPGEVVTREELRQALWPSDTFVDFDHSLNTAVNKVREVLGDSATSPRFVETLARRGYRFIAPVQRDVPRVSSAELANASSAASLAANSASHVAAEPATNHGMSSGLSSTSSSTVVMHPELEVPMPRRGLTRALFALIQVMYVCFYLPALFHLHALWGIADSFLPGWGATILVTAVMVTAGAGIPLRCYLISAVGFDYQKLGEKFRQMFPVVLALDQLWAVAPFLLLGKIGLGAAFAASAALLYVPFSERTLIRMAYLSAPK